MAAGKFLRRTSLADARALLLEKVKACGPEIVDTQSAFGRATAEPVYAAHPAPHYRASAMDGICVRAADTLGASPSNPLVLPVLEDTAGTPAQSQDKASPGDGSSALLASAVRKPGGSSAPQGTGHCSVIDTGGLLPEWADAVIRIEDTTSTSAGFEIRAAVVPGNDVRQAGEDIESGAVIVPRFHRLRPYDIGALLAAGVSQVSVTRKPRVTILATGSEVIEPNRPARAGEVIEYNSRMISGLVEEWGGRANYVGIVSDDPEKLEAALRSASASSDVVAVIAGSSAGRKDYTVDVLAKCGTVFVHGVDMMPGKPVALATLGITPAIGVPGYPVSAIVACEQLLKPLVEKLQGVGGSQPEHVTAEVRRKIPSRLGVEEFRRVCLARFGDGYVVAPLPRGAGSISTVVRADGWLRIPTTVEGFDAGVQVEIELLRPRASLRENVIVAGRPDQLTASLEDELRMQRPHLRFSYLGLGEDDGIDALGCGEAHMAMYELQGGPLEVGGHKHLLNDRLAGWRGWSCVGAGRDQAYFIVMTGRFGSTDTGTIVSRRLGTKKLTMGGDELVVSAI